MINNWFKFEGITQTTQMITPMRTRMEPQTICGGGGRHNIRNTIWQVYLKKVHLAQLRLTLFDFINKKEKLCVLKASMLVLPTKTLVCRLT